jgi:RNA polymerase sigma-70 factor (ECF subfamily)
MASEESKALSDELEQQSAWMRRLSRKLFSGVAGAEDALQEARLAALRRGRNERGWLVRVAENFARRENRDEAVRREHERRAARNENAPPADELAERLDAQRALADELRALPEPHRTTLLRHFFDGWSAARIAREAGCPATTVRTRIERGLELLRERLDRRSGGRREWLSALAPLAFPHVPPWLDLPSAPVSNLIQGVLLMKFGLQLAAGAAVVTVLGISWLWSETAQTPATPRAAQASATASLEARTAEVTPDAGPAERTARRESSVAIETDAVASADVAAERTALEGRVVDRALRPIDGAQVELVGGASARTTGDGAFRFELEGAGRTRPTLVRVAAPGFAMTMLEGQPQPGLVKHLGDIVLERGGVISGRVVDPQGRAKVGARVFATPPSWADADLTTAKRCGPPQSELVSSTTSDDAGRFRLENVAPGGQRAWAEVAGERFGVSAPLVVRSDEELSGIELVVEPLRSTDEIAGVVVAPDGRPTEGLTLRVRTVADGNTHTSGQALRPDGSFRFRVRREVPHELLAVDSQGRWPQVRAENIAPGTTDVVLHFETPRELEVRARTAAGEAIERFSVSTVSAGERQTLQRVDEAACVGGVGRVRIPNERFVVVCDAPGFALHRSAVFDGLSAPSQLEFALESEPGLTGRVLVDGAGRGGARVTLWRASGPRDGVDIGGYPALRLPDVAATALSASDGSYFLRVANAGEHYVRAELAGYAASELGPLELSPRAARDGLDLVLSQGGAIEGAVLTAPGRSAEGVIVVANRGDGFVRSVRSGPKGVFRFDKLTAGPWSITRGGTEVGDDPFSNWAVGTTDSPTRVEFNCVVEAGATTRFELDLREATPALVRGRLTLDGAPAAAWVLTAWPGAKTSHSGELPRTALDARGEFTIELDDPGRVRLSFADDSSGIANLSFVDELQRGANEWSENVATLSIAGRSTRATNPDYALFASIESERYTAWIPIHTDEQGRFELPRAPRGRAKFIGAELVNGRWDESTTLLEVELTASATQNVQF